MSEEKLRIIRKSANKYKSLPKEFKKNFLNSLFGVGR